MKIRKLNLSLIIITVVITSIITSLTTALIFYNNNKLINSGNYLNLSKDEALKEFLNVYSTLSNNYYQDFDKEKILEAAIKSMFNYLGEDYSTYLSQKDTDDLYQKLQGEYNGIGIEIINNSEIFTVFENSPAAKVGLRVGDIIKSINDQEINDQLITDLIKNAGKEIKITVSRNEEILDFKLNTENIIIQAAHSELIEREQKKIGYIKIDTFSNVVYDQFKTKLIELENQGINFLIIDVRNNTGGYMTAAENISNLFLEKGKVIYKLEDKVEKSEYKDVTDEKRDYPVAILTNKGSASASEILTAALKDSYGAISIGKTTYGKGKVQQTKKLENGGMIKYTSSKWYTPNDICIDGYGIDPDITVELPEFQEGVELNDTQKEAAINYLINK